MRPVVAQRHNDCKTDWLWVRSPLEEMKYLLKCIFPFLRSDIEAKRGVEFHHSTPPELGGVENGVSKHLPAPLCAGWVCA